MAAPGTGRPLTERILERVQKDPETGCWIWPGSTRAGYGTIITGSRVDNSVRTESVHRVSYRVFKEPIPEGMHIDHLCRVKLCCNPDHLEVVTHAENTARGEAPTAVAHRTGICQRGHEIAGDNAYVSPTGSRVCRTCMRASNRRTKKTRPERRASYTAPLDVYEAAKVKAAGEGRTVTDVVRESLRRYVEGG